MILQYVEVVFKGLGMLVVAIIGLVLIFVLLMQLKINSDVRDKINTVMSDQYPTFEISIEDKDKGPMRQRCYEISLIPKSTGKTLKKFVSINGDDDGGVWFFGEEHRTMQSCIDKYFRG
ncbi:hypothetical protein [Sphingorhabdus sp.]|uniref:hypothetical protein n=1 Tax=Sphingorhabdus sp. TaxID=1902408 RepID=UPI002C7EC82A|nr:hypothetical protein [Sphingorhabdus sp.]HMT41962.1 hypothetical protein [Sphingorhabdus sp.]